MTVEVWKSIPGYEGIYEASSTGRVRSIPRVVIGKHYRAGRKANIARKGVVLSQSMSPAGYWTVTLSKDGKRSTRRVNILVCAAFNGASPAGMQCRHLNGDRKDNEAANLAWGTPAENQRDRIDHGTDLRGEDVATAVLTSQQAAQIIAGMPQRQSKAQFGISKTQHYRIKRGEAWAHLHAWMAEKEVVA